MMSRALQLTKMNCSSRTLHGLQTDWKSGGLGNLKYPLISGITKSISKLYGVLIPDQGIALRGLFVMDKEGVIQHSTINNFAIDRSVDETMRTLLTLQYLQENSDEVCPAGWKPGDKFMKPIRNSARSQVLQVGLGTRSRSSVMVLIILYELLEVNFCRLVFASFHLMLVSLIQMLTFNNLPRK